MSVSSSEELKFDDLKGDFWITTNQCEHVQRPLKQPKKVSTIAIASSDGQHTNPNPDDIDDVFSEEEAPSKKGLPQVIPAEPKPAVTIPGMSELNDDSSDFGDSPNRNPMTPWSFATWPENPTLPAAPTALIALPMVSRKKDKDSDSDYNTFSTSTSTSTSTSSSFAFGKEETPRKRAWHARPLLQLPKKAPGQGLIHLPKTNENADMLLIEDGEEDLSGDNFLRLVAEKKAENGQAETPNTAKEYTPSLKKGGDDSTTTELSTGSLSFANGKGPATLPGGRQPFMGRLKKQ